MKLFYLVFLCFPAVSIFISCSHKKHKELSKSLSLYHESRDSLILKYGALNNDDTTINKFTYQFQNVFIDKGRLLAFSGEITDILKKDSNYILQIVDDGLYDKYIARVLIDSVQMEKFKPFVHYKKSMGGCFILKVAKVIRLSPALEIYYEPVDPEDDEYEGSDPYVSLGEFGDEKVTIFKTTLVDYFLK